VAARVRLGHTGTPKQTRSTRQNGQWAGVPAQTGTEWAHNSDSRTRLSTPETIKCARPSSASTDDRALTKANCSQKYGMSQPTGVYTYWTQPLSTGHTLFDTECWLLECAWVTKTHPSKPEAPERVVSGQDHLPNTHSDRSAHSGEHRHQRNLSIQLLCKAHQHHQQSIHSSHLQQHMARMRAREGGGGLTENDLAE
jgi:hypothetical protein